MNRFLLMVIRVSASGLGVLSVLVLALFSIGCSAQDSKAEVHRYLRDVPGIDSGNIRLGEYAEIKTKTGAISACAETGLEHNPAVLTLLVFKGSEEGEDWRHVAEAGLTFDLCSSILKKIVDGENGAEWVVFP